MYSNDGLSRNYGTAAKPRYPEAAYGFMRFQANIGRADLVGFDRLNPQLQERVIKMKRSRRRLGPRQAAVRTCGQGRGQGRAQHLGAPDGEVATTRRARASGPSARLAGYFRSRSRLTTPP